MWREVRMGKYCEQCGAELEDNNKFCSKCGTKYEEDELKSNAKEKKVLGGKKKNLLIGVGIFVIILIIVGNVSGFFSGFKKGYKEVEKETDGKHMLSMEEFIGKYEEIFQSKLTIEDFLIRGEKDGFAVRDEDDLFADYKKYTHYYYNNGATEDYNNEDAVENATLTQIMGNQRIFEILVENEDKIKAIEAKLQDGDYATAQNLMKIFIPSSQEGDYPELRNKAREESVAYTYKDGVAVKVTEDTIRIWYDTKENFDRVSKQPFMTEGEEKQIIQNSLGVWEQESYGDLPVLDISMPSDKILLIKQYYPQGTDVYGNMNYLKKECEVDVSTREYADFTKDIEYKITDWSYVKI